MNNGAVVLTSGRLGIGLWLATFQAHTGVDHEILPTWQFHNVAAEHNKQMTVAALRYPEVDTAVTNASSHDSAWIVNKANPAGSRSMDLSSSTAYTSLLALEDETFLMHYDRLANGWAGPPGRLGDSDYVFSMRVKVSRKTDDDSSAVSFQPPVSAPPPDAPQARGGPYLAACGGLHGGKRLASGRAHGAERSENSLLFLAHPPLRQARTKAASRPSAAGSASGPPAPRFRASRGARKACRAIESRGLPRGGWPR